MISEGNFSEDCFMADSPPGTEGGAGKPDRTDFSIMDCLGCLVVALDQQGRIIYYNKKCEDLTGLALEESRGKEYCDLFCQPEEKDLYRSFFHSLEPDCYPVHIDVEHCLRNGSIRKIRWTYSCLPDADGSIRCHIMTGQDLGDLEKRNNELLAVEKNYKKIMRVAPVAVILLNEALRVTTWSSAVENLLGWSRKDVLGKELLLFINDESGLLRRYCERTQKGRIKNNLELDFRRKDGTGISLSLFLAPTRDHNGAIDGLILIALDISERKKAEESLRKQSILRQLLLTLASDFINLPLERLDAELNKMMKAIGEFIDVDRLYIFSLDHGRRVAVNTHEWCAEGIAPEIETLQKVPLDFFPDYLEPFKNGEIVSIPSVAAMPKNHRLRPLFERGGIQSLIMMPLLLDGLNIGFVGFDSVRERKVFTETEIALLRVFSEIVTSVLARQKAEQALRDSERKYRDILSTMEDGYYEVDLHGKIMACNRAAAKLLGYEENELIGRDYSSLCKDEADVYRAFNQAFKTKQSKFSVIIDLLHKNGSLVHADLSLSLVYDPDGRVSGFRGLGRDITERVKMEEELKRLSYQDQLTGVYNRHFFAAELKRLEGSREYPIAIISVDLDGLKLVNDSLGHQAGDSHLRKCADLLKGCLRSSDLLARVGGDEFALILPRTDFRAGEELAERIRSCFRQQTQPEEGLPLSISTGLAVSESSSHQLHDVYIAADRLMYKDKLHSSSNAYRIIVEKLLASLYERDPRLTG